MISAQHVRKISYELLWPLCVDWITPAATCRPQMERNRLCVLAPPLEIILRSLAQDL